MLYRGKSITFGTDTVQLASHKTKVIKFPSSAPSADSVELISKDMRELMKGETVYADQLACSRYKLLCGLGGRSFFKTNFQVTQAAGVLF